MMQNSQSGVFPVFRLAALSFLLLGSQYGPFTAELAKTNPPPALLIEGEFGAKKKIGMAGTQPATTAETAKAENEPSRTTKYPYHGTVESVDATGGVLTLKGKTKNRVILVTKETRISREESRAALKDVIPGEDVSGSVVKLDGRETAVTLRLKGQGSPPRPRKETEKRK